MRTILIAFVTLLVLGGAFLAYTFLQTPPPEVAREQSPAPTPRPAPRPAPAAPPAAAADGGPGAALVTDKPTETPRPAIASGAGRDAPAEPPTTQPNQRIIGASDNVWVQNYDEKARRLASEFRAARFDPRPDDTVDVTKPEARFYLDEETVLYIVADHGRVYVPPSTGQREAMTNTRGQAPTRGELFDVRMSLHKSLDGPALVQCSMPNVVFDNDTFRIATEGYTDAAGTAVLADQVPVQVRGQDYDFDGYGLVVRWNELDGRLQTLEVARGEKLVVKNPKALKLAGEGSPSAAEPILVRWTGPLRVVPAKISRTLTRQVFRMNLSDKVRVTQADAPLADADVLEVSFTLDRDAEQAGGGGGGNGNAGDQPPIVVSLTGAPATVRLRGTQARSAVVTYDATTGSASLRSSHEFPEVAMQDADGRTIFAKQVEFDGPSSTATFAGPAKFELPVPGDAAPAADAKQPPRMMLVEAKKQAKMKFAGDEGQLSMRSAAFSGDVLIDHPQIKLNGQELTLNFTEPAGKGAEPALAGVAAGGGVSAKLIDEQGRTQAIECRTLELATDSPAPGQVRARSLRAEGGVRIDSPAQQLSAGMLDVAFRDVPPDAKSKPSLLPAGEGQEVATLLAQEGVKLRSPDGGAIDADRVALTEESGRRWLTLTGEPARIGDAKGALSAGQIRVDAESGDATVVGGGSFDTVLASDDPQRRQPAKVTWKNDLKFVAAENVASADGGVEILADQAEGTRLRGTAQRLQLTFAPETARPADATVAAPPLAGRQMTDAMLLGDVQLAGVRQDPSGGGTGGALLQRVHLFSDRLSYQPATEQIVIPSAGRMLVEDRRPAEPSPDGRGAGAFGLGSARGATAFQWSDKLTFAAGQDRVDMAGDVLVVHRPDGDEAREVRVQADTVAAELAASAGRSQGDLATPAAPAQPSPVRRVAAAGNVRVTTGKLEFLANEIEFRPPDDTLIAKGTDRAPAVLLDEQGLSRGSFREMWLNPRTQESHLRDFRATVRR